PMVPGTVGTMFGIMVEGYEVSGGNEITGNSIVGDYDPSHSSAGINLLESPQFKICNNTTDSTFYGFLFLGNNDDTQLQSNTIGRHFDGLFIGPSGGSQGRIGVQTRHGNTWSTAPGAYDGRAAFLSIGSMAIASQFRVESTNPAIFPSPIFPTAAGWFLLFPGPTNPCVSGGGTLGGSAQALTAWEMDVVTGVANETTDDEVAIWDGKVAIMYKLFDDPQLRTQDPAIETFYQYNKNKDSGKFARWEQRIKLALQAEQSHQNTRDNLYAALTQEVQALRQLTVAHQPVSDTIIDETYAANRQVYLDAIKAKNDAIFNLDQTIRQNRQLALSLIPRPTPSSDKTTRQAAILDFVTNWLVNDLTETDWENFWAYARTLSAEDGRAARWARSLLPHCEQDSPVLGGNGLVSMQNEIAKPETAVMSVYPNPASDRVRIDLPSGGGELRCVDMLGRVVHEQQFSESDVPALELDLSLRAAGTYWVHYLSADGDQYQRMFIKE
ncbi:MAG: T9SS type A sorting domain-containing protein, partial [Bacteroidota bacterium]